ncbi:efflux transporter outer membrane subunit [Legionella spiritensis]|uniref:efflux transporter outer membrane subunit n=1 Tax=Legionella spiritensis TaxID=452 RepID=UPI0039E58711
MLIFRQDADVYQSGINKHCFCIFLLLCLSLTGCMLGPDFHAPRAPHTKQYIQGQKTGQTTSVLSAGAAGKAQHFHPGQTIPAQWWRVFHSSQLNTLIKAGLKNNPGLAAAKSALDEAQQNYFAQIGTLFPSVTGNFSAERQRFSSAQFGGTSSGVIGSRTFNLYNANVAVAYTLDVFGGLRRQIEAAGAQVDYQQFELEAAFLTLSANIVTTGITIASLQGQIAATHDLIQSQEKTLAVVKRQLSLGGVSEADVLSQENQLAQTRALLPPLKQNLAQNQHALSVLVGELPAENLLSSLKLDHLHLPSDLPIGIPSLLVRQRPDIRASEALLHAASAYIGVATANLFPQITLTGNYGQQSTTLNTLFQPQNNIWNISSAVAQPIFQGGSLIAQKRAAVAAYQQAAAQYRETVLLSFGNVADVLRALQHDAQLLKAQQAAEVAARKSLKLTQKQFRLGGVSYLNLLTAQQSYQQARLNKIQAQASRFTDTAALFQALGGGWWNRPLLSCNLDVACNTQQYKPENFGRS